MTALNFGSYPLWLNFMIFAVAAVIVWIAGTRIARYANTIAERTGLGKAFIGVILLGAATSLPELAVSATASYRGDAALAVNNLLGGTAMQVAILAVADVAIGPGAAISAIVARPVVLLQGTLDVLLLLIVAAGIAIGGTAMLGVGAWTGALIVVYFVSIVLIKNYRQEEKWQAVDRHGKRSGNDNDSDWRDDDRDRGTDDRARDNHQDRANRNSESDEGVEQRSLARLLLYTAAAAAAILVAGFVLARTGDAIARQTGLGASFIGAVLVAISTSLPELSSVLSAVRIQQFELAFSDIFGTNLFDVALVFLVDAVYAGGPVLTEMGDFALFAALLGIAVTTVFLAGLIERRDRVILRMGVDSLIVLVVYLGGLFMLYRLR